MDRKQCIFEMGGMGADGGIGHMSDWELLISLLSSISEPIADTIRVAIDSRRGIESRRGRLLS
jgi:hypothetical protein